MEKKGELMDFALYKKAREVANIIHACIKAEGSEYLSVEDMRTESANPYYSPTESGLFLRCLYDMPIAVLTPCGEWVFVGGFYEGIDGDIARKSLMRNIESRIVMPLYSKGRNDKGATTSCIYAIHEVGGDGLPEPRGFPHRGRLSPEFLKEAEETWRRHTARYYAEKE